MGFGGPLGVAISSGLRIAALGLMRHAICMRRFSAPRAAGSLLLAAFGLLTGVAPELLRRALPLEGFYPAVVVALAYSLLFLVLTYPRLRRPRRSEQRLASG